MAEATIRFYRTNDKYGCFSNFSRHAVEIDGVSWPTSEHYFQAQKYLDDKNRNDVRVASTPAEAAKIGRDRNRPLRSDWESIKDEVMLTVLRAKFTQNASCRDCLLSSGDAYLIEDTSTSGDEYWGSGRSGKGQNMLGKLLMKVREELMS